LRFLSRCAHLFESLRRGLEDGVASGYFLPSSNRNIDIGRIDFHTERPSTDLLGSDYGGAGAGEDIKND
jgi:hypothetical protein